MVRNDSTDGRRVVTLGVAEGHKVLGTVLFISSETDFCAPWLPGVILQRKHCSTVLRCVRPRPSDLGGRC